MQNDPKIITFETGYANNITEALYPQLWRGLIGAWSPELGVQGQRLIDLSGNRNDLAFSGYSAAAQIVSPYGNALSFASGGLTATSQKTITPINTITQDKTLFCRFRRTGGISTAYLVSYEDDTSPGDTNGFYLSLSASNNLIMYGFITNSQVVLLATSANVWYNLVLIDRSSSCEAWINGVKVYSANLTKKAINYSDSNLIRLGLGTTARQQGTVLLYNRALSTNEAVLLSTGQSIFELSPTVVAGIGAIAATANVSETISLSESYDVSTNPLSASENETINISDSYLTSTTPEKASTSDTVNLSDSYITSTNPLSITVTETVTLSDSVSTSTESETLYGVRILHHNPLVFITDTAPIILAIVDITNPASPVKTTYTLTGYNNAKDVAFNYTNEFYYVSSGSGKVLKIDKDNPSSFTEIDLLETDTLRNIATLSASHITFVSDDNSVGEIIKIDEREIKKFNANVRCLEVKKYKLRSNLRTINGVRLGSNLRCKATVTKKMRANLRCIPYVYNDLAQNMINFNDIQILINGVDMTAINDVNNSAVTIVHSIDERTTATFTLNRRHDALNYTNTGIYSQITNNNAVQIIIKGVTEFTGTIDRLTANSQNETVNVSATMAEPANFRHSVYIPMSSVNTQIHPYDCLVHNVDIDNPYVDPLDEDANNYKKGIRVNLGTSKEQMITKGYEIEYIHDGVGDIATKIENGTYEYFPNYTYFWMVYLKNYATGRIFGGESYVLDQLYWVGNKYIGTSMAATTTASSVLLGVSPHFQRERDPVEVELGEYTVGEAPFSDVSVKNGKYITKFKWEDREDGWYSVKEQGYNYVDYAKQVAALELEKLQNINGDILPITNATIDLTLDAYYYYNLKLLTRINITNTTTANIYNATNGFPVAVKSITITIDPTSTLSVSLRCDNQKSQDELDEIDARYPDEESDEFLFPEEVHHLMDKFNPATEKNVS